MLILAVIGLIFFIGAGMGTCFESVLQQSDISGTFSLLLSSTCTVSRLFLLLLLPCQQG